MNAPFCDPSFAPVREVFEARLADGTEIGAALAVEVDGSMVVDLWGGSATLDRTVPWQQDTIVNVASASKGVVATLAHIAAQRGDLDLDAAVHTIWPEFGFDGKTISVAQLLDHTAGLPAIREPMPVGSIFDWELMTSTLASEAPWWEPGSAHGYHAVTFGFLVGAVLRRTMHDSVSRLVQRELAEPFGLDVHIGLPRDQAHRVAESAPIKPGPVDGFNPFAAADKESMVVKAFTNPPDLVDPHLVNSARWRQAQVPASNAMTNARALARLYGNLASDGVGASAILHPDTIIRATAERVSGTDAVLGMNDRFALGFMLPSEMRRFGRGDNSFGHPGAGGPLGFADRDARLGFGYTPNQPYLSGDGGDHRWPDLIAAVYRCL
jgi:CubicO group peptidase (beta-lactamase class C family)